jgi:cytoskeletal protein CcmA (bactofilin family)
MWKRRKDDTPTNSAPEPTPRSAAGPSGAQPAPPPAVMAPRVSRTEATIGKTVVIKGDLTGEEDVHLDGQITEGSVSLPNHRLTVGKSGKVRASITAHEVDIHGTVNGNIEAKEKIIIRAAANLVGNLKSASITIEDGAYFKGSIDIVRPTPARTPTPPAPPIPPRPQQQPPASNVPVQGGKPPQSGGPRN